MQTKKTLKIAEKIFDRELDNTEATLFAILEKVLFLPATQAGIDIEKIPESGMKPPRCNSKTVEIIIGKIRQRIPSNEHGSLITAWLNWGFGVDEDLADWTFRINIETKEEAA